MSVSIETLEKLKAHLRQQKQIGQPISQDLYSHLIEVFNRVILHHPNDGFDKFEEISALVKQTNFKITDPKTDFNVNSGMKAGSDLDRFMPLLERAQKLYTEQDLDGVDPLDQALVSSKLECVFPNLHEQA